MRILSALIAVAVMSVPAMAQEKTYTVKLTEPEFRLIGQLLGQTQAVKLTNSLLEQAKAQQEPKKPEPKAQKPQHKKAKPRVRHVPPADPEPKPQPEQGNTP